ncbi:hypothetical protein BU26DRAFT_521566 [Trematosphaeria pertusa]|uniref:Uncharacterized protein n=1 Tax=Trematosphaeria pertusa TaxID=390896 RepID=A0A6A6I6T2_9PLEO|nr:uncharacterized protein BU26DRAFT_521566 [Trematosphaeria pertusa]KAF2246046.1 hypothetical protein BU26DRAFT_521566 [Trematosphaeria pertusa]
MGCGIFLVFTHDIVTLFIRVWLYVLCPSAFLEALIPLFLVSLGNVPVSSQCTLVH